MSTNLRNNLCTQCQRINENCCYIILLIVDAYFGHNWVARADKILTYLVAAAPVKAVADSRKGGPWTLGKLLSHFYGELG